MQTCIAEHRALWLGSWRTWFFGFLWFSFFFSSACWLDTVWSTRPLFSPSLWSVLCEFSFLKVDLFYFIFFLSWVDDDSQLCWSQPTLSLIYHTLSLLLLFFPFSHSSPPIFPFPLPYAFFSCFHPSRRALACFMSHRGGYGPDLHCWAEAAELLKRIPHCVWAADSPCVIIVLLGDATRSVSLFNRRSFIIHYR